jgi:vesicle-fusing ATPase
LCAALLYVPIVITFSQADGSKLIILTGSSLAEGASSGGANNIFHKDYDFVKLGIGGLDVEFNEILRRAFASRIWVAHIIKQMDINHLHNILLFASPGCGKTLIACQIGKVQNVSVREPKIVNGSEILDKLVGGSEQKIWDLFAVPKKEMHKMGNASIK